MPRNLNPNLAGPHFQLFNQYRQAGRADDAARELKIFQEIKKRTAGAAVPEDMEWSYYAEIYETVEPQPAEAAPAALKFADRKLAGPLRSGDRRAGGAGSRRRRPRGSARVVGEGVRLYKNGTTPVANSGLEDLKDVTGIAPAISTTTACRIFACSPSPARRSIAIAKGVFEKARAAAARRAGSKRPCGSITITMTISI